MRKIMVVPLAGLLALTIAAPAMAAPNVSNTSGTGKTIYGEWSGARTYGYVQLGEEVGKGAFGDIYQETGEWVLCEPGAGPVKGAPSTYDTTPGDEVYGFVGTRTYGYAVDLHITLSRRLESGSATGSAELTTETVNECEGIYGGDAVAEIVPINVTVAGVGSLASFRGSGQYKIPSEFNGHDSYRGTERQATGSVVVGSAINMTFGWAYMSQVSWTQHTNG
jgi:hypothetical protein